MEFHSLHKNVIQQLVSAISQLTAEEYGRPCKTLFNASIGQHVRHVIELHYCLFTGYETGNVNYEERKRDTRIETDREFAVGLMNTIIQEIDRPDKELLLYTCCNESQAETFPVKTNYFRELIYNLEHTVHHMALIRIGINEVAILPLPEGFGVASSTIKYRKACVQ